MLKPQSSIFNKVSKIRKFLFLIPFSLLLICGFAANPAHAFGALDSEPFLDFEWDDSSFGEFHDDDVTDGFGLDEFVAEPAELNPGAGFVGVMQFDIAGIMLGMDFASVYNQFFRARSLYTPRRNNAIVYSIPRDWKNNLDYECRQQKIFAPAALSRCINSMARQRGLLYASEMHLLRESTGETISVYFTSNTTDNVVWRVEYNNDVDKLEGDDPKFEDQREKKILAFWQGVLDKYNQPNSGNDRWISSDNTFDPMMTAYYGRLELTNYGLNAYDAAENFRLSRENFRAKPYFF